MKSNLSKVIEDADSSDNEGNVIVKTNDRRCQTIVFVTQTPSKGSVRPYVIHSYKLHDWENAAGMC